MTIAVLSGLIRPFVEPHLPDGVEARYFMSTDELLELVPEAEIGWLDLENFDTMADAVRKAEGMKWLNSIYAGLDFLPLDLLQERGTLITNGAGINAIAIAEYVVMVMLGYAKDYPTIVRARDRHEWLPDAPGKLELAGTRALLLGYGAIGKEVKKRLDGFDVEVVPVRRSSGDGSLGPDEWRDRLGEFDWVILAVPATPETENMIGADELAAMKESAVLVNVARGVVVDQPALVDALQNKAIGGALLDVMTPEPLPADHPLWELDNAFVSAHLSGRMQSSMFQRSAARFVRNLQAYVSGGKLEPIFDPARGY